MTAAVFHEEWFAAGACENLAELVRDVADVEGLIVEVGSWEGRSTVAIANAAHPRIVHAVDTWAGSPGEPSETIAAGRDVHAQFLTNVDDLTAGNVKAHRMDWRDYAAAITEPVAFLFIDAEHTYQAVLDTLAAFGPHLAPGAVVCGDDIHHPPVITAVVETFDGHIIEQAGPLWIWRRPAPTLADRYAELCSTPSDIHEHLPTLVDLVKRHQARHVIELGTRTGTSTIALLHALEQTGGRLTSIDIEPAPDIGTFDHWTFIQGDDLDPTVTDQLEPADIVFVDTSHLYDQTLKELNLYRWFCRKGGVMVCHDTELEHPYGAPAYPRFPVRTAVEEYCSANGFEWTNRPNCWGLGIIEVR